MSKIVVYSNQPMLVMGLRSLIAGDAFLELSAACSTLEALWEHLATESPDLALLDLTPEISHGSLTELQNLAPDCKLVLWTNSIAPDFALHALTIGVRGVLRKALPLDAHLQCLRRVMGGELWFEKQLADSFRSARRIALSRREGQLVALLARGLKNKEISHELGITEGTVKVYLSHLFRKSGAKDRFELALNGLQNLSMAGVVTESFGGLRSLMMEP